MKWLRGIENCQKWLGPFHALFARISCNTCLESLKHPDQPWVGFVAGFWLWTKFYCSALWVANCQLWLLSSSSFKLWKPKHYCLTKSDARLCEIRKKGISNHNLLHSVKNTSTARQNIDHTKLNMHFFHFRFRLIDWN